MGIERLVLILLMHQFVFSVALFRGGGGGGGAWKSFYSEGKQKSQKVRTTNFDNVAQRMIVGQTR